MTYNIRIHEGSFHDLPKLLIEVEAERISVNGYDLLLHKKYPRYMTWVISDYKSGIQMSSALYSDKKAAMKFANGLISSRLKSHLDLVEYNVSQVGIANP